MALTVYAAWYLVTTPFEGEDRDLLGLFTSHDKAQDAANIFKQQAREIIGDRKLIDVETWVSGYELNSEVPHARHLSWLLEDLESGE